MDIAVIKGMPVDEVNMLIGNMNIESNNKYYKAFCINILVIAPTKWSEATIRKANSM